MFVVRCSLFVVRWTLDFGLWTFTPSEALLLPAPLAIAGKRYKLIVTRNLMKIALAADHAGFEEKEKLKSELDALGVAYTDMGTDSVASVDYPDFARKVAEAVAKGEYERGILLCGSGAGMAIAANKVPGIRSAVAWNEEIARLSREHNNTNVLALAARFTADYEIKNIVKAWLDAEFDAGRHERRIEKITKIEQEDE